MLLGQGASHMLTSLCTQQGPADSFSGEIPISEHLWSHVAQSLGLKDEGDRTWGRAVPAFPASRQPSRLDFSSSLVKKTLVEKIRGEDEGEFNALF